MSLVDTHCHLSDRAFRGDLHAVIARAREAGVERIVAVGGGGPVADSERSAEIAAEHDFIRATAGIHPHDASTYDDETEATLERLLTRTRVVAVGETGLDYHYDNSPRDVQRDVLARHLQLARKHDMPIVIHCRKAEPDLHDVLAAEVSGELRGVVHCFTGDYEDARAHIDKGLLVSFTGILTFKNADALREVARRLPLDRLMVETDAPLLAPAPHRGKRNEPAWVGRVVEVLAQLHGTDVDTVADATTNNAVDLFFR
jgi:TatD DNase family protein